MIRKWTSKLRKFLSKRVVSPRRKFQTPIKLSFEPDKTTGNLQMPVNDLSIRGETEDLSFTGIAFTVSSIRLREYYLVGEGRKLNAEINLPNGKVKMQLIGQRYKQVGKHVSVMQYLIGARILNMSDGDRETYKEFLRKRKNRAGSLELEVDES